MKASVLAGLLTLAVLGPGWSAEVKDNPYQDIVNRNAFALRPPPPPAPPASEQAPPSPVDVQLTGITTIGGVPKVLLQFTEKGPNKKTEFPPPLVEKDVQGRIEVVSINPDKGSVTIKIDGNEKVLTFEKDGVKAGGPATGVAAAVRPPGLLPPPNPAGTIPLPGVASVAGATAAVGGPGSSGVLVGGAQPSVATPGVPTPGLTAANASAASLLNSTIPTRPLRTGADAAGGVYVGGMPLGGTTPSPASQPQTPEATAPAMSREQAIAHIEEQRALIQQATDLGLVPKNRFPPLPPTSMTPRSPGGTPPVPPPMPGN